MKAKNLRILIPLAIITVSTVAYMFHFDFGTLSAFGWSTISVLCPLGALTTTLAEQTIVPRVAVTFLLVVILMILFGKAFCAWICPVPVVRKLREIFGRKKDRDTGAFVTTQSHEDRDPVKNSKPLKPLSTEETEELSSSIHSPCANKRGAMVDSRHIILGGSVLTALIFGFPVFCLICPIGLTFASLFLIVNLFSAGDLTWSVVLVPLLLLIEIVFFRKWCSKICPLSAFMSLTAKVGRFFRPKIDDSKCIETTTGSHCGICGEVCPESVDPRHPDTSKSTINECTKCRICLDACPSKAIHLPVWSSGNKMPQERKKIMKDER